MRFFAIFLVFGLLSAVSVRAAGFVPGIEDLPLMPALNAEAGSEMVFDTPSGRIVEARATGAASRDAVEAFYAKTLPQLGWAPGGAGRYTRENEELRIDFPEGTGLPITVRFSLKPAP